MTIRGVPYENRGPVFGQPNNHNSWEDMSQAPAQAFRTDFSAPAPARHGNSEPSSYDGGYNQPPKGPNHRTAKIVGAVGLSAAVLIGGGVFAANSFTGDKKSTQTGTSEEGVPVVSADQNEDVIFGDACAERDDIYQVGLLNVADGKGGLDQQRFDDLANNVIIKDGRSGIKAPEITSIPENVLDQIRTSITLIMQDGELVPAVVNLYGERQSDWDDYDGELNSGLKACV